MKRNPRGNRFDQPNHARGFVLAVVVIIVLLLTLAAYNYSGTMLVEHQAAAMGGRDVIARTAAESAIELAATRIMERGTDDTINLYNDPDSFRGRLLQDSPIPRAVVRCSVIAFDETNSDAGDIRFGLANENSKFNINRLLEIDQSEEDLPEEERLGVAYIAMSNIPNMTDDIVDAILDWLDSDEERRTAGAEGTDYATLAVPYECRNGPMETLDELLKVQGVTPDLYYGEDANHNGILDEGEDVNGDGYFDLGWQSYLTAESLESNTTPDGEEKINLNGGEMTELFDAVEEEFGVEAAKFVVGFRLAGAEGVEAIPGGSPVAGQISREGINLTIVPTYQFESVYDLIERDTLDVDMIDGSTEVFTSPWPADTNTLLNIFPDIENAFTITDDSAIEGRININQARREVLLTIPAMTEIAADSIISVRPPVDFGSASSNILARRNTAAWILAEGIVELEVLRELGPYITVGGDVYRFQAIGHFDEGGPTTRLEATVDASVYPPIIKSVRDLTSVGRGYHPTLLKSQTD